MYAEFRHPYRRNKNTYFEHHCSCRHHQCTYLPYHGYQNGYLSPQVFQPLPYWEFQYPLERSYTPRFFTPVEKSFTKHNNKRHLHRHEGPRKPPPRVRSARNRAHTNHRHTHHRLKSNDAYRVSIRDSDGAWRTVYNRRRPSPHFNHQTSKHSTIIAENNRSLAHNNRYISLTDMADEPLNTAIEPYPTPHFGHPQRNRGKGNRLNRFPRARLRTTEINFETHQEIISPTNSKVIRSGSHGSMVRPEFLNGKMVDTAIPGADKRVSSVGTQPVQLQEENNATVFTWADLLKVDTDKIPSSSLTHIQKDMADSSLVNKNHLLTGSIQTVTAITPYEDSANEDSEKFIFFGEEGFDSIQIESKQFKFAVKNNVVTIFEIRNSLLKKIALNFDTATQIIQYLSYADFKLRHQSRFGPITVSPEFSRAGNFVKITKAKGSSILIPIGQQQKGLNAFLNIFSNFVGLSVQEDPMILAPRHMTGNEVGLSISKEILNLDILGAGVTFQETHSVENPKQKHSLLQAYSDASDSFDPSDDSFFSDDFLGHATESDRRIPISTQEDIQNSDFNRQICYKSQFITQDNSLPTENLNTQLKIYRKTQKNKRRHSMRTRSQSKNFPWA
ncbi:unnamed protein product [Cuscuta epithymum]|uniref:Uncharacterized protein n=1 Tax=Cuscuta epithymum TaxID=186058 RepID=A0AAV0C890_9ASTE|nr:unnamed protein product [Cuscuta epithymum]